MKKDLFFALAMLLLFPLADTGCQTPSGQDAAANSTPAVSADADITVPPSLLKTAEWAGFKYKETLARAQKSDSKAIFQMLDFSGTVDGVDALNHAVVLLEMIPAAKDHDYALVVASLKPNLRKIVLERMILAQGRTKNESFKRPMAEWAPLTWDALNNKPVQAKEKGDTINAKSLQTKEGTRNPDDNERN